MKSPSEIKIAFSMELLPLKTCHYKYIKIILYRPHPSENSGHFQVGDLYKSTIERHLGAAAGFRLVELTFKNCI